MFGLNCGFLANIFRDQFRTQVTIVVAWAGKSGLSSLVSPDTIRKGIIRKGIIRKENKSAEKSGIRSAFSMPASWITASLVTVAKSA